MKPQKLEIGLLRYLKNESNTYNYVELKPFLLNNFPEKQGMKERLEIKRFLKFFEEGNYIEIKSKSGISIVVEAGKPVGRDEISVIARLTPKGLELLKEEKSDFYNKFGIVTAFILSLGSFLFSFIQHSSSNNLEANTLKLKNEIIDIQRLLRKQDSLIKNYKIESSLIRNEIDSIKSRIKKI